MTYFHISPLSRIAVSRVTSAPITRPTTVTASLSLDDVMSGSSRRPSRLRPATLSLCSSSSVDNQNASATSSTTTLLRVPSKPAHPARSRTYDSSSTSSRSEFASSYQFLCSTSRRADATSSDTLTWLPLSTPPPTRPLSTVSAALSAEAFESPKPTSVLPHLLLGCQADAMSKQVCEEYGITHIINVSADGEASPHVPPGRFLRIPIHDNCQSDMTPFFESAFTLLGELYFQFFFFIHSTPLLLLTQFNRRAHAHMICHQVVAESISCLSRHA